MTDYTKYEIWVATGSQHLYGDDTLNKVESHSIEIANSLDNEVNIPIKIIYKTLLTTPDEITRFCKDVNHSDRCIGLMVWMHTFSPAKMWINGLKILHKPLLHFHTQYNIAIPWSSIDMDFMNLNQSAHGGREFGHITSLLGVRRKVVVGHWQDGETIAQIGIWCRAAAGYADSQSLKIARIGDNMREVAVTDGNKVSAQIQMGYSVNGYGINDLEEHINDANQTAINDILDQYQTEYAIQKNLQKNGEKHQSLIDAARIEVGLRSFLNEGGFNAFTDTFENLGNLKQLPGIAVQRLMADGYGFGGEGDWKTAALVRTMKVMGHGLSGGNSFMEDYTYHLDPKGMAVLGSHMLEICPSISDGTVRCESYPLGIGGKEDPVRLVFNCPSGPALNTAIIDKGDGFRMLVNTADAIETPQDLPNLPVARVLWEPHPDLKTSAAAWILAGGPHHTCYSQNLTIEHLEDLAIMLGIEMITIDQNTDLRSFKTMVKS